MKRLNPFASIPPLMSSDDEVTVVRKSYEYNKFEPDTYFRNDLRVNYLMLRYLQDNIPLPVLEVKQGYQKLIIINDQDVIYAAKALKLPVYYYETFNAGKYQSKDTKKLSISDDQLNRLRRFIERRKEKGLTILWKLKKFQEFIKPPIIASLL